jgi:DNA-binding GntR family transcriptional regulator
MNELEDDLHVRLLSLCGNRELLGALRRTRCTLTLSKHVLGVEMKVPERDPFMDEHVRVVDALIDGKLAQATRALVQHLRSSLPKVADRLEAFRASYSPPPLAYIS